MHNAHIPVSIITGFLGSGKTTVLNHLLRDPRLTDTAVIVNEFGEVGLDHLLVESAIDQMVLLENGCVCCSVRGDLVDTLEDLLRRVAAGTIPPFRHVMIETTGLADPAPIVHTLVNDEATAARFQLQTIVTTVDGVNATDTLKSFAEARSQVAMADILLITKADMPEADVPAARQAVISLNNSASVSVTHNGSVDPNLIVNAGAAEASSQLLRAVAPASGADHEREDEHGHHHQHGHHWDIQTASILIDEALPWQVVTDWLEWLTAMRGADVLRIKGLLRVKGIAGPVLIHGVQHVFHTPRVLADWPGGDPRSRIILIARDIPELALRHSLAVFRARHTGAMTV